MKIIKEIMSYLIIILIVVIIRTFIVTPVKVDGLSMYPTLNDKDVLLLKKYDRSFERFDIVVIKFNNTKLVKRIIGLPGESVKIANNNLYINHSLVEDVKLDVKTEDFSISELGYDIIPEGYYFVLGDNRVNSVDSRTSAVGLISKDDIIGVTSFRIFPFNKIGGFK